MHELNQDVIKPSVRGLVQGQCKATYIIPIIQKVRSRPKNAPNPHFYKQIMSYSARYDIMIISSSYINDVKCPLYWIILYSCLMSEQQNMYTFRQCSITTDMYKPNSCL